MPLLAQALLLIFIDLRGEKCYLIALTWIFLSIEEGECLFMFWAIYFSVDRLTGIDYIAHFSIVLLLFVAMLCVSVTCVEIFFPKVFILRCVFLKLWVKSVHFSVGLEFFFRRFSLRWCIFLYYSHDLKLLEFMFLLYKIHILLRGFAILLF